MTQQNLKIQSGLNIKKIEIEGLASIAEGGLQGLKNLEEFKVYHLNKWDGIIPDEAFKGCKKLCISKILGLKGVNIIFEDALEDCCYNVNKIVASKSLFRYHAVSNLNAGNNLKEKKLSIYFNNKNINIVKKWDFVKDIDGKENYDVEYHIPENISYYSDDSTIIKDIKDSEYDYTALEKIKIFKPGIGSNPRSLDDVKFMISLCDDKHLESLMEKVTIGYRVSKNKNLENIIIPFDNNIFRFCIDVMYSGLEQIKIGGGRRVNSTGVKEKLIKIEKGYKVYRINEEFEYALPITKEAFIECIENVIHTYSKRIILFNTSLKIGSIVLPIKINKLSSADLLL